MTFLVEKRYWGICDRNRCGWVFCWRNDNCFGLFDGNFVICCECDWVANCFVLEGVDIQRFEINSWETSTIVGISKNYFESTSSRYWCWIFLNWNIKYFQHWMYRNRIFLFIFECTLSLSYFMNNKKSSIFKKQIPTKHAMTIFLINKAYK